MGYNVDLFTFGVGTASALDADPQMRPTNSIFWKSKSPWYVSPHELPKLDGYK